MPLYEYECQTCHHQFEVQQKFSDPLIDKCIRCGNEVRKLISAPGIMFKGTGWYVTDYSNKLKDPNQAKQPVSPSKEGTGSGAEKAESKSEAGSTSGTSSPPSTSPPSSSTSSGSSSDSTT